MSLLGFQSLEHPIARWLLFPSVYRLFLFIGIVGTVNFFPIMTYFSNQHQRQTAERNWHEAQDELLRQQKILAVLKQKSVQQQLTPELAAKTLPLNRFIQQNKSERLHIPLSRWTFNQGLVLQLTLEGHFADLSQLLTALLTQPNVALVRLSIFRQDDSDDQRSIESSVVLQLMQE